MSSGWREKQKNALSQSKHWLPQLLLGVFFCILFFGLRAHSQSWYFQDENEHTTLGWMIFTFGKKLYADLSTNHQPIPIFFGGLLVKLIPFTTLYQLIEGLRISMWAFAALASVALVFRFRWKALLPLVLAYSLSYYFFAFHVLAEALTIPAVVFIMLELLENQKKEKSSWKSIILFVVAEVWLIFTLAPLWFFVLFTGLWRLWTLEWKQRAMLVGTGFLLLGFVFLAFSISPLHWWQETIVNNSLYFIPYESSLSLMKVLQLIFYPILHLTRPFHPVSVFYLVTTALFVWLIIKQKKKVIFSLAAQYFAVVLLNTRVFTAPEAFYTGFHLYPAIAGWATLSSWYVITSWKGKSQTARKIILLALTMVIVSSLRWVIERKDKITEHTIQYSPQSVMVERITMLKKPNDRLLTGPDGKGNINILTGLSLAGRQNFHLEWAWRSPQLRQEFVSLMENNPPELILFELGEDGYSEFLKPILTEKYVQIEETTGKKTNLYQLKE